MKAHSKDPKIQSRFFVALIAVIFGACTGSNTPIVPSSSPVPLATSNPVVTTTNTTNTGSGSGSGSGVPVYDTVLYMNKNSSINIPNIYTNSILKVIISGVDSIETIVNGSNTQNSTYTIGCIQASVTVNGQTSVSGPVYIANSSVSGCPSAQTSATLDFSSRISGSGATTVTVSAPQYDHFCNYVSTSSCPTSSLNWVSSTNYHQIKIRVQIQTNGN